MSENEKRPAAHVLAALLGENWAIVPDWLDTIHAIAERDNIITPDVLDRIETRREALAARKAAKMDGADAMLKRDGIAMISLTGPIVRYADLFSSISGATSIETLATDFNLAMDDPSVRGVMMIADSPGGQVNGVNEMANMIRLRRGEKPLAGYIANLAGSAAYWIVSAVDPGLLWIDATAEAGSIGIVGTWRKAPAIQGRGEVVSSQTPKKRLDPESEAGQTELRRAADAIAGVFIDAVRTNRGEDVDLLDGGLAVGQAAVDAGLADRVGSFEDLMQTMHDHIQERMRQSRAVAAAETELRSLRAAIASVRGGE